MSDAEASGSLEATSRDAPDVEMGGDDAEVDEGLAALEEGEGEGGENGEEPEEIAPRLTFVEYAPLQSTAASTCACISAHS